MAIFHRSTENNAHMIYVTFNKMKMGLAKCIGKNMYAMLVDIFR